MSNSHWCIMGNTNTDTLHIDFETRSQVDLKTAGVYNYASDLSTEVLMMGWAFNDEPAKVWLPDETFPKRIIDHIRSGAYKIGRAHV